MKSSLLTILALFSLGTYAVAGIELNVVYPKPDQVIPSLDSTFIFGNVSGADYLAINGTNIPVHKSGGWLAFLPVNDGDFIFHLVAWSADDTLFLDLPVSVGRSSTDTLSIRPNIPIVISPEYDLIYSVGDTVEFTFKAPPGGSGWFRVGKADTVRMFEVFDSPDSGPGSVFGESSYHSNSIDNYVKYSGTYTLTPSDTAYHLIYYRYIPPAGGGLPPNATRSAYLSTDYPVKVIPETPPLIGILTGRSIIRDGPGLGYKLLYQPSGIKVHITGSKKDYYKLDMAEGVTGFVNVDSVELLPIGSTMPRAIVSFISAEGSDKNIKISVYTGDMFPYEINESINPAKLDIDLYGVTGDIDWIRYNNETDFPGIVKWSQPSDDIFRMTIELADFEIGGYKPYYDNGKFVLEVSRKPRPRGSLGKPLKGMKILLDPGHSHDTGALGPTGFPEKDANLWIAHELRLMLEKKGAEVLMTRYGHEHVPLYNRPAIARRWGADLMISIHNNALPDGINPFENNGTSVYYYHPHSKPLAEAIHRRLVKATGLKDHGLYYGNLVLTRPTSMPAVLVECAFMMIPEQEAMLKTDKFQKKCAKAIMEGIEDYLKSK